VTLGAFCLLAEASSHSATGQRRRQRLPSVSAAQKSTRDYSVFQHEDHRKEANGKEIACLSCHTISAAAQPDRIAAATRPSAQSAYPYHDSCFRCHRQQVYHGDRPAICTVCHTRVSPRATARDVYSEFPSPKRSDMMTREFPGYFPHGIHQGVIAFHQPAERHANAPRFVRASLQNPAEHASPVEVCARCHLTDERGVVALPSGGIQPESTFEKIAADTFKTIPGYSAANAHAFCFNCHWQSQKPTKDDCNGCHLARTDYASRALQIIQAPVLSAKVIAWFKDWPVGLPKRFSLKFRHDTHTPSADGKSETNGHDIGCTACHINIAQMTTLNIPKADVQISSCGPCHVSTTAIPLSQNQRATIFDELTAKADTSKNYVCVACHVSVIGRAPTALQPLLCNR
jgi:hypothetical protein